MASVNKTATIVPWKYSAAMIENGWSFVALNDNALAFRGENGGSVLMVKEGDVITRSKDGVEKGIKLKRGEVNGDDVNPTFVSGVIPTEGNQLRVLFSKPTIIGPMSLLGLKLNMSSVIVHLEYLSMDTNPNIMIFSLSRVVLASETGGLRYTQPGGGIQDDSGNDVPTFAPTPITNNSTQV
jgi:hypothetical protein